jgi:methylenetetrahydrofolate reductase (NADPH)
MKITDVLSKRDRGFSFEFFPPKSIEGKEDFMGVVGTLAARSPVYVSVTYGAGGSTRDRTRNALLWITEETDLAVMSHLTCIGAERAELEDLLGDYKRFGVDNILALRGDPPKDMYDFKPSGEFRYALDLVRFVREVGDFSVAVACYPEGHQESPSLQKDIEYTRMKVDAGADFAITQMFFDNRYYYDFLDRARKAGITVPIFPGIMPVTDFEKIRKFAGFCHATIPPKLEELFAPALGDPEESMKLGVHYAVSQCEDLLGNGVRYLHFYTLNKSDAVLKILDGLSPHFT